MKDIDLKCRTGMEKLRAAAAEMEEALKEEGFEEQGPIGVFVRTQRAAIEELGAIVTFAEQEISGKVGGLCDRVENSTKKLETAQLVHLDGLFKGAEKVLVMARELVVAAMAVKEQIAVKTDYAIAGIAKTMGGRLLDDTQKWLLEAQHERIQKQSLRIGLIISFAMLGIAAVTYQVRGWQDAPTLTALERCAVAPIWAQVGDDPQLVPMCRLDQVAPRDVKDLPFAIRDWFREWWS